MSPSGKNAKLLALLPCITGGTPGNPGHGIDNLQRIGSPCLNSGEINATSGSEFCVNIR
ncbi:hypothetical protein DJICPGNB_25595 [Escherichia coli]|nr:hypothetical protein DJICPGNB_25595 [Escherichia coli]